MLDTPITKAPAHNLFQQSIGYMFLGLGYSLGLVLYFADRFWGIILLLSITWFLALYLILSPSSSAPSSFSTEQLLARARKSLQQGNIFLGERYYCQVIYRLYHQGQLDQASEIFEEYFRAYKRVFSPRIQLELCKKLSQKGKYLISARALEGLIQEWEQLFKHHSPQYLERAYLHLARIYGEKLNLPTLAIERYFQFLERFPNSPWRETAIFQLQLLDQKLSPALKKVA